MKKILSLVLCLLLALLCVGCSTPDEGGSSSDAPASKPDISATESTSLSIYKETDIATSEIIGFSDGVAVCCDENAFFLVDKEGNKLPDTSFRMIYPFSEGVALALTKEDKWVQIGTNGKVISDAEAPKDTSETVIYSTTESVNGGQTELFGVKGLDGKILTEAKFEWISSLSFELNYAILNDGKSTPVMINKQGAVVATLEKPCINAYKQGNRIICQKYSKDTEETIYYLADLEGKKISNNYFSGIGNFVGGKAPAVKDGKLVLISEDGEIVAESSIKVDNSESKRYPLISNNRIFCLSNGKLIIVDLK